MPHFFLPLGWLSFPSSLILSLVARLQQNCGGLGSSSGTEGDEDML